MLKISFHTFGCKNNLADTSKIVNDLQGFSDVSICEAEMVADVHVINTCTVTSSSDAQARNLLRRISKHNKDSVIVITGCSVRRNSDDYKKLKEEVKWSGNILEVCDNLVDDVVKIIKKRHKLTQKEELEKSLKLFRTRVFVQIQDGCDHFCSYCIVPFVRGEPQSREIKDIISEAQILEKNGIKELVITGINIGDYDEGLEFVIAEILKKTKDIRIRLSSLRPSRITEELVDLMQEKRVCPHLHISLQSASDKVLNLMNRHDYTAKDFISVCKMIDKKLGHRSPFIAADVIVGHPGEDDKSFLESFKVIEQSSLTKLHVFPYSPRPGTAAFSMKRPSSEQIQKRRDVLLEFSDKRFIASLKQMKGKTIEVLWETNNYGHSENYYPVKGTGTPNTIEQLKVKDFDIKEQTLLV